LPPPDENPEKILEITLPDDSQHMDNLLRALVQLTQGPSLVQDTKIHAFIASQGAMHKLSVLADKYDVTGLWKTFCHHKLLIAPATSVTSTLALAFALDDEYICKSVMRSLPPNVTKHPGTWELSDVELFTLPQWHQLVKTCCKFTEIMKADDSGRGRFVDWKLCSDKLGWTEVFPAEIAAEESDDSNE
jgi:hypothetical protein